MSRPISQTEWNYWFNKVYGYFYRRLDNQFEVEELTAMTLNHFFLTNKIINSEAGFLWHLARCNFLNYLASKKTKKFQSNETVPLEDYEQNQDYAYNNYYLERVEALKKCVQKYLQPNDYQIVEMCIMQDFSSTEVSKELQLSPENVRQKLSRSLKKVRQNCREVWVN